MTVTGVLPPPARGSDPAIAGRGPMEVTIFDRCIIK